MMSSFALKRPFGRIGKSMAALLGVFLIQACSLHTGKDLVVSRTPIEFFDVREDGCSRTEKEFVAADGARLGYIEYTAGDKSGRTAIVYLHGIESHAGWFDRAAQLLATRGYDVYCLDRRGSGINRENRGFPSGHVDSYEILLSDIHTFIGPLRNRYQQVYLAGLSWGGKLALAHALAHPEDCDGLTLITPGIKAAVDVSLPAKIKVVFGTYFRPRTLVKTPIKVEMFTATPKFVQLIREDPLRLEKVTARFLWQSLRLDRFIAKEVPRNRLPIQLFLAGQDRIINNEGVVCLLARGKQERLEIVMYEDQTHSVQFDAPERLTADMRRWIQSPK